VRFRDASGRASLWSWIVMHRQYFPDFPPPYIVALVELEEGPMLMSTVVGCDAGGLRAGLPLVAVFERVDEDHALLKFKPL
jgi:uncharacterized OB-fold protein